MIKFVIFLCGFVTGVVVVLGAIIHRDMQNSKDKNQLVLAPKDFYDNKETGEFGYVGISGTLAGKNLAYPNNTYAVSCYSSYRACFVAYVEQIGHEQIGRMENPRAYPIVKWTDYEVVAQDQQGEPLFGCHRVSINIDRQRKTLLWVEEPINQTKPICKDADTSIRKYSIEDSRGLP